MNRPRQLEIVEHAIQLNFIGIKEIHFESDRLPSTIDFSALDEPSFTLGRSDYDPMTKTIQVTTRVEIKAKKDSVFGMRISLIAQFRVNEDEFPAARVHEMGGQSLLLRYFSLSQRRAFRINNTCRYEPHSSSASATPDV